MSNLTSAVIKTLSKELMALQQTPLEGISIIISETNLMDVQATITGPPGTPYQKGSFKVALVLGPDFPNSPPKGYFITKIFHPNVSSSGEICVSALKKDWKPTLGISHLLLV